MRSSSHLTFLLAALLLSGLPMLRASTFTQADCSLEGVGASSGESSCSAISPMRYFSTMSDVSVNFFLAAEPADYNVMTFNQQAVAGSYTADQAGVSQFFAGRASSTLSFAANFTTAGVPRPGYIQIGGYAFGESRYLVSSSYDFGIPGSLAFSGNRSFTGGDAGGFDPAAAPVPIWLGTPFSLFAASNLLVATDSSLHGPNFGFIQGDFEFRFLEADGATPVTVVATPEPASWCLLGASTFMLLLFRRVRAGRLKILYRKLGQVVE